MQVEAGQKIITLPELQKSFDFNDARPQFIITFFLNFLHKIMKEPQYKKTDIFIQVRACSSDDTWIQLWEPTSTQPFTPAGSQGPASVWRLQWQVMTPKPVESKDWITVSICY